jgi:hypothetical protein
MMTPNLVVNLLRTNKGYRPIWIAENVRVSAGMSSEGKGFIVSSESGFGVDDERKVNDLLG